MIQDSPADYHSHTGALIVGDRDVGEVLYKGNLQQISRLPFAGDEVEMIEKHLGIQPLLGKQGNKEGGPSKHKFSISDTFSLSWRCRKGRNCSCPSTSY